ncbi:hypothetical protein ACJJI4_12240 [Microbulbifer sp. TRSA002]|uniref:hypothetical protein n=1 Tax=Microbulbifer sp. TRSA002 TaxID=3243382 RepID=UPI00403A5523
MKDQEIYSEIAKLLYCEAPDVSSEIHALALHVENSSFISAWTGELKSFDGSFSLSVEALRKITSSVNELKEYYLEENMGGWNIAHFIALPSSKRFELEFDYCEELEKDEISFSEYAGRLKKSSRIHPK